MQKMGESSVCNGVSTEVWASTTHREAGLMRERAHTQNLEICIDTWYHGGIWIVKQNRDQRLDMWPQRTGKRYLPAMRSKDMHAFVVPTGGANICL